jgi:hypothetical protein
LRGRIGPKERGFAMTTETEKKETVRITLIYVGRRKYAENKIMPAFQMIAKKNEEISDLMIYKGFQKFHFGIGTVISVDASDESGSSVFTTTFKIEDRIEDEERIAAWTAQDAAAYAETQRTQIINRVKKESRESLKDFIAPIKRVYRKLPSSAKNAFIVLLLNELDRPL